MARVEILLVLCGGYTLNSIGVIEQKPDIADSAHATFRAKGGQAGFHPGKAEDAFFRPSGLPVKVDLLVRAAGNAITPASASLLIHQHDSVLFPFVERS
jgi:hypothetical protein